MPADDVLFLKRECARLKDENQLLTDEVKALRRYISALQRLQETVQRFTPEQDILILLDETLDCALELMDAADGSLLLLEEDSEELVFVLTRGQASAELPGYRFDRDLGIAGWVVENVEPAIVHNVRADSRFMPEVDEYLGYRTRNLIAVPLVTRDKVLGVIEVLNKRGGEDFSEDDASLLSILAALAASALDYATNAAAYVAAKHGLLGLTRAAALRAILLASTINITGRPSHLAI